MFLKVLQVNLPLHLEAHPHYWIALALLWAQLRTPMEK